MKQQIRKSIFETNSSSTHALVVNDYLNDEDKQYFLDDFYLELTDEFSGMDFEPDLDIDGRQSFTQKIQYLYVYCMGQRQHLKAFKAAISRLERESNVEVVYNPKHVERTRFYNTSWKFLDENMFYINHESNDCLEEYFNAPNIANAIDRVDAEADLIYEWITSPKYSFLNKGVNLDDQAD